MNLFDIVNGTFELAGGLFVVPSILKLFRAKDSRAISPLTSAFFLSWGVWNLLFYPHLHQFYSTVGAVGLVTANAIWLTLVIRYRKPKIGDK